MGYTFRFLSGGVDALERLFGHARTSAFVASLLGGEAMTDLCLESGISRKTGYNIFNPVGSHPHQQASPGEEHVSSR